MLKEDVRKMLQSVINGDKWECHPKCSECSCKYGCGNANNPEDCENWQPYELGDEVHSDWTYRKVEKKWMEKYMKDNPDERPDIVASDFFIEFNNRAHALAYDKNIKTNGDEYKLTINDLVGIAKKMGVRVC